MIVADTNVVSELMRAEPSPAVRAWVLAQVHHELRITAITVAEILYGIERLPNGRREDTLRDAAVDVFSRFTEDVLPFDAAAATIYPEIVDHRDRKGTPISGYDAQIAAICRANDASLATRNENDFAGLGVELINPWSSG
ncbi:MAG TPA: type II toxin-antitoxin system VapC family toxin [Acidimicrobiales bacterium]|nr:type II toxin-antitoxin system VapC family toxin [Acidimicrobiales bacterium]